MDSRDVTDWQPHHECFMLPAISNIRYRALWNVGACCDSPFSLQARFLPTSELTRSRSVDKGDEARGVAHVVEVRLAERLDQCLLFDADAVE